MNSQIFLSRESFSTSRMIAQEWPLICVNPNDMLLYLVALVKSFSTKLARIFCPQVRIVHVIEDVAFHSESHAANVTLELFKFMFRKEVKAMLLFVISQSCEWLQNLTANCARDTLTMTHWIVRVNVSDVHFEVRLDFELFSACEATEHFLFRHFRVAWSDVIAETNLRGKFGATKAFVLGSIGLLPDNNRLINFRRRFLLLKNFLVLNDVHVVEIFLDNFRVVIGGKVLDLLDDEALKLFNFGRLLLDCLCFFLLLILTTEVGVADEGFFLEMRRWFEINFTSCTDESWKGGRVFVDLWEI